MKSLHFLLFTTIIICASGLAVSAQVHVIDAPSDLTTSVLKVESTYTGNSDKEALVIKVLPNPGYGIGASFFGGYIGLQSNINTATSIETFAGSFVNNHNGNGIKYGIYAEAKNGTGIKKAIYSKASGNGTNTKYGIYAECDGGPGGNEVVIEGEASIDASSWAAYFDGQVNVDGLVVNPSDERLKYNIADLESGMDYLLQLKPLSYEYKSAEIPNFNLPIQRKSGFLAQDVNQILPHLVKKAKTPAHLKNIELPGTLLHLNYLGLLPVITNAIQEQQEMLMSQKTIINEVRELIKKIDK